MLYITLPLDTERLIKASKRKAGNSKTDAAGELTVFSIGELKANFQTVKEIVIRIAPSGINFVRLQTLV